MTATSASSRGSSSRWAGDWMAPSRTSGSPNSCWRPGHVADGSTMSTSPSWRSRRPGSVSKPGEVLARAARRAAPARGARRARRGWRPRAGRPTGAGRRPGRLHSLAELVEVGDDDDAARRSAGRGWAGRTGRRSAGRGGRPWSRRSCPASSGRSSASAGAMKRHRVGGVGGLVGRRRVARPGASDAGQLLEQRPVGVEGPLGPLRAGDRHDGDAAAGDRGRRARWRWRPAGRPPGPAARS